jgi:flagellar basal body-associated protein FliL
LTFTKNKQQGKIKMIIIILLILLVSTGVAIYVYTTNKQVKKIEQYEKNKKELRLQELKRVQKILDRT